MKKKEFVLSIIITSIISFVTVIIIVVAFNYFLSSTKSVENNNFATEKYELAKLDSLIAQKEYYNKLLFVEMTGQNGEAGYSARAKYLEKIIVDIDREIEKIVPNDTIEEVKDEIRQELLENIMPEKVKIKEDEIIETVKEAELYLREQVKTREIVQFYYTRLKKQYAIIGLSRETNAILLSTITKIKKEIEKLNEPTTNIKKDTDNLEVKKVQNDTLQFEQTIKSDSIILNN
jgi:hypothetical protein